MVADKSPEAFLTRMQTRMQTWMQTSTTQPVQQCIFHTVNEMGFREERPSLFQMEDGARRSMMGDSSTLLSHYHEDAKTMYEVFQRGLHITGERRMHVLPHDLYWCMAYATRVNPESCKSRDEQTADRCRDWATVHIWTHHWLYLSSWVIRRGVLKQVWYKLI